MIDFLGCGGTIPTPETQPNHPSRENKERQPECYFNVMSTGMEVAQSAAAMERRTAKHITKAFETYKTEYI